MEPKIIYAFFGKVEASSKWKAMNLEHSRSSASAESLCGPAPIGEDNRCGGGGGRNREDMP